MSAAAAALERLLEPLTDCFTPEVARRVADLRANLDTQARIDELAAKANEGNLTAEEAEEYRAYVDAVDLIGVLQAKARVVLRKSNSA